MNLTCKYQHSLHCKDGKIYQTKTREGKVREVSFPVSKKVLNQLNIDHTIKYEEKPTTVLNRTIPTV